MRIEKQPTLEGVGKHAYSECGVLGLKTGQPIPVTPPPVVATVHGVTEHRWAESWLRSRAHVQLDCHQDHGILSLVTEDGAILKKQMSSECFAEHLRSAYDRFVPVAADTRRSRLTSNSAKATALSWCAKYGLPVSTRRMLGSHKKNGDKIVLVCSRDALSEPLRQLDVVITQIRINKFHPDVGWSGMVASSPMSCLEESEPDWYDTCGEVVDFSQTASHVNEESDSDTDSSESSSSSTVKFHSNDGKFEAKTPTQKDIVTSFNGSLVLNLSSSCNCVAVVHCRPI